MKTVRIGAASNHQGGTIVIEDRGYNEQTPRLAMMDAALQVADLLTSEIPSGTLDRLMEILLNREIANYQARGDAYGHEQAEKLMAVADLYRARR